MKSHESIRRPLLCFGVSLAALILTVPAVALADETIQVQPDKVVLPGKFERAQLLVSSLEAGTSQSSATDVTRKATYQSSNPSVVTVSATGQLLAAGDGTAEVTVTIGATTHKVPVTVTGFVAEPKIDYLRQVAPILSKAGCNMGACHASQYGKGGFKLSVFGFDPHADHAAIVRDHSQRRVNPLNPEASLFLEKPTMQVPHGGSRRLRADSVEYATLAAWVRSGAAAPSDKTPAVTKLTVSPQHLVTKADVEQQLRVEAEYADGSRRDVTALARYNAMDESVLEVSTEGLVKTVGRGQAPAMVRFEGQAEIAMFVVPFANKIELTGWTNNNYVDELASAKFRELGIEPSPICDDATFLRRAFLDTIGTQPSIDETRTFLASNDPQKRNNLVDRLLGLTGDPKLDTHNDPYAAWWTLKWSDLLRNDSNVLGEQGMWAMHNWLKEAFRTNKPLDKFVRELVTAKGSIYRNGPANFFRINGNASDLAEATAQLFLGVRLQCAKCHHHPFEKYAQDDYYQFASFFARVGSKGSQEFGLFGGEQVVIVRSGGEVSHPKSGKVMKPVLLEGKEADNPLDRRIPLAEWLTSPANNYFARSIANRYVSYLLGRGLVEPVDDLRATNPASNPELLDALAKELVESGYNVKKLLRSILTSRLYQLDSQPTVANASDRRFYSHFKVKRISAEALLDAIDASAGTKTKFQNLPLGTRAIELPDAEYPDYFLKTFGKPRRVSVCECERSPDESLAQALHTLNGDIVMGKIAAADGRIAKLLAAKKPHDEIVEEIYLATLSRLPSAPEKDAAKQFLAESPTPKDCYEDLEWALVNSKQFLFVH
ncbi:MAG: DUF1549 domain-containing protein [Planctomycetaceae bacterium]